MHAYYNAPEWDIVYRPSSSKKDGAPGFNLKNPGLSEYSRVFIRCNGPGHNVFIWRGTSVLYEVMNYFSN